MANVDGDAAMSPAATRLGSRRVASLLPVWRALRIPETRIAEAAQDLAFLTAWFEVYLLASWPGVERERTRATDDFLAFATRFGWDNLQVRRAVVRADHLVSLSHRLGADARGETWRNYLDLRPVNLEITLALMARLSEHSASAMEGTHHLLVLDGALRDLSLSPRPGLIHGGIDPPPPEAVLYEEVSSRLTLLAQWTRQSALQPVLACGVLLSPKAVAANRQPPTQLTQARALLLEHLDLINPQLHGRRSP